MILQKIVKKTKEQLIQRDGEKCGKCNSINELTIDHIVPLQMLEMMGINRKYTYSFHKHGFNLQLLCRKCNALKTFRFDWTDTRTIPNINRYINSLDVDLSDEIED